MPWSHQTSILKPFQNSFQLKTFPKTLPIPHFVQTEHREGFAGWFGARDLERTQSLLHHVTFDAPLCILMLLSQLTWIIFFSLSTTSAQDFSNEIYETYEEPNVSLNSSKEPKTLSSLFSQDPWNLLLSPAPSLLELFWMAKTTFSAIEIHCSWLLMKKKTVYSSIERLSIIYFLI